MNLNQPLIEYRHKINFLREKVIRLMNELSPNDPEVVRLSQKVDRLIIEYTTAMLKEVKDE